MLRVSALASHLKDALFQAPRTARPLDMPEPSRANRVGVATPCAVTPPPPEGPHGVHLLGAISVAVAVACEFH